MEMTPIGRQGSKVSSGDGATPHGRDLSSTDVKEAKKTTTLDPNDIAKREVPIDQTAETIAAMLRRTDHSLSAEAAARLAKALLERTPPITSKAEEEPPAIGATLDVSA